MSEQIIERVIDDYGRPVPSAIVTLVSRDEAEQFDQQFTDQFGKAVLTAPDVGIYTTISEYAGIVVKSDRIAGGPVQFKGEKGDPGGNAMAIGLFTDAVALTIPAGVDLVQTSGHGVIGRGAARYAYDRNIDVAYINANPLSSFLTVNGRGYALAEPVVDVTMLGVRCDGAADDTDAMRAAIAYRDVAILAFADAYRISDEITLPIGRTVRVQPGTRHAWIGPAPTSDGATWKAMFVASGQNAVLCEGGEFTLEAATEMQFLSVAKVIGVDGLTLVGAKGINCTQIYVDAAYGDQPPIYASVVTPEMVAAGDTRPVNIARNVDVKGGGCIFPKHTIDNSAPERSGALLFYVYDARVDRCDYQGCYAGVQWWGGNSDIGKPEGGDPDSDRKCKRVHISRCTMKIGNAGFWGSMGQTVRLNDCESDTVRDLGIDPEGNWDFLATNCLSKDGYNGCYSAFSWNRNVVFEGCTAIVSKAIYPLFRIYNSSAAAANNRSVAWRNGIAICNDPSAPGMFDAASGPCRQVAIEDSTFENVAVSFAGGSQTRIKGNTLRYTREMASAFKAISLTGLTMNGAGIPLGTVEGNRIISDVSQPEGSIAIYLSSGDFNSSPDHVAHSNIIRFAPKSGTYLGIVCEGVDVGNSGTAPAFSVYNNIMDANGGPITKTTYGAYSAAGNYDFRGNEIGFVDA